MFLRICKQKENYRLQPNLLIRGSRTGTRRPTSCSGKKKKKEEEKSLTDLSDSGRSPCGVIIGIHDAVHSYLSICTAASMMQTRETFNHTSFTVRGGCWSQDGGSGNNTSCISHSILSLVLTASCVPMQRCCNASDLTSQCILSNGSHWVRAIRAQILQYIL